MGCMRIWMCLTYASGVVDMVEGGCVEGGRSACKGGWAVWAAGGSCIKAVRSNLCTWRSGSKVHLVEEQHQVAPPTADERRKPAQSRPVLCCACNAQACGVDAHAYRYAHVHRMHLDARHMAPLCIHARCITTQLHHCASRYRAASLVSCASLCIHHCRISMDHGGIQCLTPLVCTRDHT
jgi:hypothetical protein